MPKPDDVRGFYRKISSRERKSRPSFADLPHTDWEVKDARGVGLVVLSMNLFLFIGNLIGLMMMASGIEISAELIGWWKIAWMMIFFTSHLILVFGETILMRPIPFGGICFSLLWFGGGLVAVLNSILLH